MTKNGRAQTGMYLYEGRRGCAKPFRMSTAAPLALHTNHSRNDAPIAVFAAAAVLIGTLSFYIAFQYKLYLIGLGVAFLAVALTRGIKMHHLRYVVPIFLFHAWVTVSSFWSPLRSDGLGQAAVDMVFLLFALVPFAQPDIGRKSFSVLLVQAYAVGLLGCIAFNYFSFGEFLDDSKGAFRSLFGIVFLAAIPFFVGSTILSKSKIAALVLAILLGIGVQLENRVFNLFALPVLLVSLIVTLDLRGIRFKLGYAVGAMVVLIGAVVSLQLLGIVGLADTRLGEGGTSFAIGDTVYAEAAYTSSNSIDVERRLATRVAIDLFQSAPVIGAGYMSTPFYTGRLTQFETAAHGLPTGILSETGLIGGLLFVIACIMSFKGYLLRARISEGSDRRWAYVELTGLLATLIGGMFHQPNHDFYLYLLIGGGLASRRLARVLRPGAIRSPAPAYLVR